MSIYIICTRIWIIYPYLYTHSTPIYIYPHMYPFLYPYIYNVGKTIIRHPQVHHFYGYYKPLPVMGGL